MHKEALSLENVDKDTSSTVNEADLSSWATIGQIKSPNFLGQVMNWVDCIGATGIEGTTSEGKECRSTGWSNAIGEDVSEIWAWSFEAEYYGSKLGEEKEISSWVFEEEEGWNESTIGSTRGKTCVLSA